MKLFDIIDYGAKGDGNTDNSREIQAAINECSNAGGGIVKIPADNIFMTGPFNLKSNVELRIEKNSVILANPDESVYTKSAFRKNFGEGSIWIGGENADNVTISGEGIIDGNGAAFMGPEEKAAYILKEFDTVDPRPHLFTPVNFKNLVLKDVTFKNSAYWCLHLVGCSEVSIKGIKILNNLKIRNSDGIDLDHSRNVEIENCRIESGDDCICFKTRREYEEYGPTENIMIDNCTMISTSCSIKLGSENMDAIRNVIVKNCIIKSSNRGIGIQNRDEGTIENIKFENISVEGRMFDDVWWGKAEPIYVTAYKRKSSKDKDANVRFAKGQTEGRVGNIKNIVFSDIQCRSENGVFVGGENEKIKEIHFINVNVLIDKRTKFVGGLYDLRPSDTVGLLKAGTSGFYLLNAVDIKLNNCKVSWGHNKPPYFEHAVYADNINGLELENFDGKGADEKTSAIEYNNCKNVKIISN